MIKTKLRKKIKSPSGESIAETLVALLIAALALVMLAGAMTAASNMIAVSRKKMNQYYENSKRTDGVVIMNSTPAESENVTAGTITITDTAGPLTDTYNVYFYKNTGFSETPVVAYKLVD